MREVASLSQHLSMVRKQYKDFVTGLKITKLGTRDSYIKSISKVILCNKSCWVPWCSIFCLSAKSRKHTLVKTKRKTFRILLGVRTPPELPSPSWWGLGFCFPSPHHIVSSLDSPTPIYPSLMLPSYLIALPSPISMLACAWWCSESTTIQASSGPTVQLHGGGSESLVGGSASLWDATCFFFLCISQHFHFPTLPLLLTQPGLERFCWISETLGFSL